MSGSSHNLFPQWSVQYNGNDITQVLKENWKEIRYDEVIGGEACHLMMYFADATFAMQNGPPTKGDTVSLSIGYQGSPLTSCGTFQIDEFELIGPPDIFVVKCVEAGVTAPLRSLVDFAYENTSLIDIANKVAARHGMTAVTDAVSPNVQYDRITQNHESDLAFLHRIANQHNYDFNVRNNQLIFYNRIALEQTTPLGALDKNSGLVKQYRLHDQTLKRRTFQSSSVQYFDPNSKKLWSQTTTDPNMTDGDHLNSVERLENSQQGTAKSQAYLHEHNMLSQAGEITVVGSMLYRAGTTVNLTNFGYFDNYVFIVDKARHILNRQGYTTRLELRTTLNKKKSKAGAPGVIYFEPSTGKQYTK